jgi:hypothetical protein
MPAPFFPGPPPLQRPGPKIPAPFFPGPPPLQRPGRPQPGPPFKLPGRWPRPGEFNPSVIKYKGGGKSSAKEIALLLELHGML